MVDVNRLTTPANMRWKLIDRETGAENAAIDWRFRVGDRVKIRLLNEMAGDHPMHHPFHVHGAGRFLVLSRDGVVEDNLVWKDTVLLRAGETVDILLDVTNAGRMDGALPYRRAPRERNDVQLRRRRVGDLGSRRPPTPRWPVGFRTMAHGTHDFEDDARNERILIWVNGELVPRERAVVSVFDSGFVLGDGVWEGLRVWAGHPAFLERHLDRLFEGAKAIMLDVGRSRRELTEAIYSTLRANDMTDGVHVRLMVTRGVKSTPYQDPRVTIGPATVVIIAEHKEPLPATVTEGITLFTTHVRRAAPDTLDPKLNSHSKLNDITACIQAYTAGADEALMLDPHGFVATCNSTHFFVVVGPDDAPEVLTSDGRYCLAGITRANVLEICRANGIPARETTFSLTDVYAAREAFVTGTFAGVVPVRSVDGRTIGDGRRGPMVERLQALYRELVDADVAARVAP